MGPCCCATGREASGASPSMKWMIRARPERDVNAVYMLPGVLMQVKYVRDVPESATKPPPVQQARLPMDDKLNF